MIEVNESKVERLKSRQRQVMRNRTEVERKIKEGTYIEWLKQEHGVMDEDDVLSDREFLNDIIREIERNRERSIVYDYYYKRSHLDEWIRWNERKIMLRRVGEKAELKKKLKKIGGPRLGG